MGLLDALIKTVYQGWNVNGGVDGGMIDGVKIQPGLPMKDRGLKPIGG
jgi:hypothetical protein